MEKYFENGTLDEEDIYPNLAKAIAKQQTLSGLCGFGRNSGSDFRFCSITSSNSRRIRRRTKPNTEIAILGSLFDRPSRRIQQRRTFFGLCFPHDRRSVRRPNQRYENRLRQNLVRCRPFLIRRREFVERLGALHALQGKNLEKVNEAQTGDIIAVVKLKDTQTGDTLCDKANPIVYPTVEYPEAAIAFAIEPKSRADEDKISSALHKILEEDPSLHFDRDRAN